MLALLVVLSASRATILFTILLRSSDDSSLTQLSAFFILVSSVNALLYCHSSYLLSLSKNDINEPGFILASVDLFVASRYTASIAFEIVSY